MGRVTDQVKVAGKMLTSGSTEHNVFLNLTKCFVCIISVICKHSAVPTFILGIELENFTELFICPQTNTSCERHYKILHTLFLSLLL